MSNFKCLHKNLISSTGALSITSGTGTLANIIDRDITTKHVSSSQATSTSIVTYSWKPSVTQTVSRIGIRNCNFETVRVFYNSSTANTFTPDLLYASNTSENLYFEVATQAVTSVQVECSDTIVPSSEKYLGELYIGNEYFEFSHNPTTDKYIPTLRSKSFEIEMSDGGIKNLFFKNKFRATIEIPYVTLAERTAFKTLYDLHTNFYFMPYPVLYTSTASWDGDMFDVNWLGDFDFLKFSSNVYANGYTGKIKLAETPDG